MCTDRENWYLWQDKSHNPAMNMAIDESLLQIVHEKNIPLLRIYDWDRTAMSIGYVQKYEAVIKEGYELVRRPTGGGVVFHDVDLTYTVVIPKGNKIERTNREESYYIIHKVVIDALGKMEMESNLVDKTNAPKDRSSMQCFVAPVKFDVSIKNSKTGKDSKVAGAAQRRTKHGILHQGSIVLDDINNIKQLLINNLIDSFREELNIEFINFIPDNSLLNDAEKLAVSKYGTDVWNKKR
ncbi:MAG TPA: biotin/lipoate A/B protein ligase family protein [Victivallales bacterium]|nr:biotin/lipoate A/B protein ligase family protein [Victivallales bacterium]